MTKVTQSSTSLDPSRRLTEKRLIYTNLAGEVIDMQFQVDGAYIEPEYDYAYGVTVAEPSVNGMDWVLPKFAAGTNGGRVASWTVDGVPADVFPGAEAALFCGPNLQIDDEILVVDQPFHCFTRGGESTGDFDSDVLVIETGFADRFGFPNNAYFGFLNDAAGEF